MPFSDWKYGNDSMSVQIRQRHCWIPNLLTTDRYSEGSGHKKAGKGLA